MDKYLQHNINENIRVKLTGAGIQLIQTKYPAHYVNDYDLQKNILELPMFDIMIIFGKFMNHGGTDMFIDGNFYIEDEA